MATTKTKADAARLLGNIAYNASSLSQWQYRHDSGEEGVQPMILAPIDPWPARELSRDDQLLLAVNNISFQEVKDTQAPIPGWERQPGLLMEGWKGTSFIARFSLNQGDPHALRSMLESSRLLVDSHRRLEFVHGDVEEGTGSVVAPIPSADGTLPPVLRLMMPRGNSRGITLRFTYDDHTPEYRGYPQVIVDMTLDAKHHGQPAGRYTPAMEWEYRVILNSSSGRLPNESVDRKRYDMTKAMIRSALTALGVTPFSMGS